MNGRFVSAQDNCYHRIVSAGGVVTMHEYRQDDTLRAFTEAQTATILLDFCTYEADD